jgi:hypothetical protein
MGNEKMAVTGTDLNDQGVLIPEYMSEVAALFLPVLRRYLFSQVEEDFHYSAMIIFLISS